MGLRERLQQVTQLFQKAASRGHQLRQEDGNRDRQTQSGAAKTPPDE
jgi:hypothetical protein